MLDEKGTPHGHRTRVDRCRRASQIGPITRRRTRAPMQKAGQPLYGHYEQTVDRESAYEKLTARTAAKSAGTAAPGSAAPEPKGADPLPANTRPSGGGLADILFGSTGPRGGKREGMLTRLPPEVRRGPSGSGVGRAILRGALGSHPWRQPLSTLKRFEVFPSFQLALQFRSQRLKDVYEDPWLNP